MVLTHTHSVGGKGEGPNEFGVRLSGITVDTANRLLAVGDREVKRFSADGKLEGRFPTPSVGWSIYVDGDSIWVGRLGGIDEFDHNGRWKSRIEDKNRLGLITGLAVRSEILVAADASNRTIHLFKDGEWQREVGHDVNTRGFMLPNGVLDLALDVSGESFVVAHPQKHRVERYSLEGKLVHKFGRFGMENPGDFGGCCNPTNITATVSGVLAVSEKAPPRVKIFTREGKFVAQSPAGVFDASAKNIDLASDRRGRLYATDSQRCTIEVFDLGPLSAGEAS